MFNVHSKVPTPTVLPEEKADRRGLGYIEYLQHEPVNPTVHGTLTVESYRDNRITLAPII